MGGLLVSFGDALGGQLLAQPGMLVVHVLPLSLGVGVAPRSPGPEDRVEPDLGLRVEAGLAIPKARRSSTPCPRSTSPSALLAFGATSKRSSTRPGLCRWW
jgi:hypothetical protein